MISESKTPKSNAKAARMPLTILVSSNMKKTGPIMKLKIKPVTTPLKMIKPKIQILSKFRNILAISNR